MHLFHFARTWTLLDLGNAMRRPQDDIYPFGATEFTAGVCATPVHADYRSYIFQRLRPKEKDEMKQNCSAWTEICKWIQHRIDQILNIIFSIPGWNWAWHKVYSVTKSISHSDYYSCLSYSHQLCRLEITLFVADTRRQYAVLWPWIQIGFIQTESSKTDETAILTLCEAPNNSMRTPSAQSNQQSLVTPFECSDGWLPKVSKHLMVPL
jgi:hypothetical protein